jgi:hypothetical protein
MSNAFGIPLLLLFPVAAVAQTAPAASDLRVLVEAMQQVTKPSAGKKIPPLSPSTDSKKVRLISFSTLSERPLPLLLDNRSVPIDSLNRYTLSQVLSVNLNLDPQRTALFGASGSWGVIEVKLKKKSLK